MAGTIVGSVGVSLVPNAEGWHEKAAEEILPQAEELGREFGEAFRAAFNEASGGAEFTPEMNPGPADAEIAALEEKIGELSSEDIVLTPEVNAGEAVAETETLGTALQEAAAGAREVEVAAADASVAIGDLGGAAGEADSSIIALSGRERELLAGILEVNPALDIQLAALEAQSQAAQEAALSFDEYRGALSDLPAEWLQVRDALFELQQGESLVVGRGGAGGLNLLTGGEAESFVADQSRYTNIQLLDRAMVAAAFDANQLSQAEDLLGMSFSNADASAAALRDRLAALGLSDAEAAAGALALADAIRAQQAAQESAAALGQAGPATGSSLIDNAILRQTAASVALADAQGVLGISETEVAAATERANAVLLQMGFSEDQATAGALALAGAMQAQAAATEELAAVTSVAETVEQGFVATMVIGTLTDPFFWILAAVAGLGLLIDKSIRAQMAVGSLSTNTEILAQKLRDQDKAVGFNLAGFDKYISQVKLLSEVLPGDATAIALLQQAQVHVANLSSNLEILSHMYGLDRVQTLELAKAAGVTAAQLAASGTEGQKAMSKVEAYANTELHAASSTAAFSREMEIANGLAGSLATRVQALQTAMDDLFNPTLNMITTTNQFDNDLTTLKTDLAASGDKIGTFTQAQRDAGTQMAQTVQDAIANAGAIKQVTGSSAQAAAPLIAMRAELESLGVKGGETGKIISELDTAIAALKDKTVNISVLVHEAFSSTGGSPIIPGTLQHMFADGGVVPGYAPGVDSRTARVSPGESIMVPEWTAAHGADWVNAQNAYYSSRRPGRSRPRPGHFANGGVISDSLKGNGDTFNVFLGLLGPDAASETKGQRSAGASASVTVAQEFARAAGSTPAQIEAAGRLAIRDLAKYYTGPHEHELAGIIEKQTGVLAEMSRVQARIQATIQGMRQASSQEIQALQNFSSLSSMHFATDKAGVQEPTGKGIKTNLDEERIKLRKFYDLLGRLHHMGVSKVLIDQCVQLGVDDGTAYAEAILSGGTRLIGTLNREERAIGGLETEIGHRTADIQFGQSITRGWLTSLDKDKAELHKRMRELGDEIAREMLKALGGRLNVGGGSLGALDRSVALGLRTLEGIASQGGLSRADVNQIETFLHHIGAAESGIVTKRQGDTIISLLRRAPHATGSAMADPVA